MTVEITAASRIGENYGRKRPLMATIEQFVGLHAQMNEIVKRVGNGSLDPGQVRSAFQAIIEKRGFAVEAYVQVLPDWYIDPAIRLERAKRVNTERRWGFHDTDFPSVPADSSKLWLLVINLPDTGKMKGLQRTVDEFWDIIEPPNGYTKYRDSELKSDPRHLRLAPGLEYQPGIYWVEFDPDAYQGKSPENALELAKADNVRLAGTEVLHTLWQFPNWSSIWFRNGKPAPNLSGLQFRWDDSTDWSYVLYVLRWDDYRQLELRANWADYARDYWASPSVREC